VLDGDFEIEAEYALAAFTPSFAICGGDASQANNDLIRVDPFSSTIQYRVNSNFRSTDTFTEDSKVNRLKVTRVGTAFTIYRNDVEISSITETVVDFQIKTVGQRADADYMHGSLLKFKVKDKSEVVLDFGLDEDGTNGVVYNNAATLGAELDVSTLVTPNSLTTGIVYNNEDSEVTLVDSVGGLSHALALFNDKVLDGSHYLVTITIDTTASSVGAFLGVANSSDPSTELVTASAGEIQTFTQVLSPVGSGSLIFRLIGISALDDTVVFSNISIKEIPSSTPYGTRINMTSANTERFTLYDTYWRGSEELWAYSPITLDGSVTLYNTIAGGYGVLPENEDYIIDLQWDNLTGRFKLLVGDSEFVSNLIGSVVAETGSKSLVFSTLTSQRAVIQELDDSGTVADSMVASINRVLEIAA
jgi:hypothetical protein